MLTKNPGDTFTLTAIYTDKNGRTDPLASLPVATEPTLGTLTPVGTPTVNDPQFQFTGTIPLTATSGAQFAVAIHAEGDPKPGVDPIDGTFTIGVALAEDTNVTITGV